MISEFRCMLGDGVGITVLDLGELTRSQREFLAMCGHESGVVSLNIGECSGDPEVDRRTFDQKVNLGADETRGLVVALCEALRVAGERLPDLSGGEES